VGWEIDLDAETRAAYARVGGALGEKLARSIVDGEEGAHFALTAEERCPFLRRDGLCQLILELGEDALCQICSDHPRFRQFYGDRVEIGLGLCCEAAGELILFRSEPMRLVCLEGPDGSEDGWTDPEEEAFFARRAELLALASDGSIPLAERLETLLTTVGTSLPGTAAGWREILLGLERLDPAWDAKLDRLERWTLPDGWDGPLTRLLEYFLYRHLSGSLEDGRLAERVAFSVLGVRVVGALLASGEATRERLVELARLYSSEIEYDEDNVEALLAILENPAESACVGMQDMV
jgi:lysine-N-methylase